MKHVSELMESYESSYVLQAASDKKKKKKGLLMSCPDCLRLLSLSLRLRRVACAFITRL